MITGAGPARSLRGRAGARERALASAVGVLCVVAPAGLSAQGTPTSAKWFLRGLQGGACIEFLVSPTSAADELHGAGTPVPAESLAEAHPALARAVRDDPHYQGWIPAEYCFYLYASGVANGRNFTVDGGRQPVAVGFVGIAARDLPGGATSYAAELFTNSSQLERVAEDGRFRVESIRFTRSPIPEFEDVPDRHRYMAKHGSTIIQWDGGPGAPQTPEPRSIRLAGMALTSRVHLAQTTITPDSAFVPSGNLQVMGKGDLKVMLTASPIRLVTTFVEGGDADWDLIP